MQYQGKVMPKHPIVPAQHSMAQHGAAQHSTAQHGMARTAQSAQHSTAMMGIVRCYDISAP